MLRECLAECFARRVVNARDHVGKSTLGDTDRSHAVVDASGAEAALNDFEAAAFTEDHVGDGDAAVGENEFTVTVWGVYRGVLLVY